MRQIIKGEHGSLTEAERAALVKLDWESKGYAVAVTYEEIDYEMVTVLTVTES